ncbi:MAG TPA: glycosyltransferase family 4 protein [Polyangiaceae bacterium]|jgi:glycosyltransferase involved in cell wall biosynthesis
MRIALVTTSFPARDGDPSGHFVRAEAHALEAEGHEVVVVAPRARGPGGAFGWPGVAARLRENPARGLEALAWVLAARRRVARIDAQRVVAHWAVPCAWPVGTASRAELVVVSHGGDVRLLAAMPAAIRARIVGAIAARAVEWRFVSDALRDALLASLASPLRARVERMAVVRPAALEVPAVGDAVARKKRELAGARIAVSVGRLVPSKRVDRAIIHVARAREVDALVVVGDGPERARLEALARTHGVDARFVGVVPREESLAWIGAADHVVFASEAEGASTVLREAEALGTRVVMLGAE